MSQGSDVVKPRKLFGSQILQVIARMDRIKCFKVP